MGLEMERLQQERDLYLRLLELGHKTELTPLLEDALMLVVETTGAEHGYLELDDDCDGREPRWSIARGCTEEDVAGIRQVISRGIIAEALATGELIQTPSALLDQRFSECRSVRTNRIGAVLCARIGDDETLGALYLHSRAQPGRFSDRDVALVQEFARHVAPFVSRLLVLEQHRSAQDPTRLLRQNLRVPHLIGRSTALAEVLRQVALVAPRDVAVLITGSSGTGKTALARAIHDNSRRCGKPFVELNCANLSEELAESELFGALPGAHSTARTRIQGKVDAANGGTLFLDEVGELSARVQAKLLQLLQSKQYFVLGSARPESADVRVIAATNADLEQRVRDKQFREDLYFRLSVIPIRMPDLSERQEDIRPLAEHFCRLFVEPGDRLLRLSFNALLALTCQDWPGNVRQLENVIQAGVIRAQGEGAHEVARRHLFPESAARSGNCHDDTPNFHEATRRFQRRLLVDTLTQTNWNVSKAARQLELARSTLHNLIRYHNLKRQKR